MIAAAAICLAFAALCVTCAVVDHLRPATTASVPDNTADLDGNIAFYNRQGVTR